MSTGMSKGRALEVMRDVSANDAGSSMESGLRPATAPRLRVLLAEDEDMVRKVLARMLAARGYEVHAASSGPEALAIFAANVGKQFDLLVTDLMMPNGGGLAMARQLSEQVPNLKVLFVSGYSSAETEGWDPERHRFLTKPFGAAELGGMLDQLLQV